MAKVRQSRFLAKKRLTVTIVLLILVMLTVVLFMLLGLGIFSLPMSADDSSSYDLSTYRRMASKRGKGSRSRGEHWAEVISWEPRAFLYHNFLSKEECEYLIKIAKPHMRKSSVVDRKTGKSKDSRVRTSSGMFLRRGQDKIISDIEKRIAEYSFMPVVHVTMLHGRRLEDLATSGRAFLRACMKFEEDVMSFKRLPWNTHGEGLQVLHYEVGQKYDPHLDYFLDTFNIRKGGQRMATMLMYLTDVEEGGETIFPAAQGNVSDVPWWDELSECGKKGLAVKPKMGNALLFWSMKPDATVDPSSLHGGCPVIKGDKWSSTKWMHVNEY